MLLINPEDIKGQLYIKKIKLSLAAAFVLYDNYIVAIAPFYNNSDLRRIVNGDNVENINALDKISKSFGSKDNYKKVLRGLKFINKVYKYSSEKTGAVAKTDKDSDFYDLIIQKSFTAKKIKDVEHSDFFLFKIESIVNKFRDMLFEGRETSMNEVSKFFGNTMGLVATRKGKLSRLSKEKRDQLKGEMRPLDVMLEKTPFRLTDRFIPGHWGHVAIWTGTEGQLKKLGVWDKLPALYQRAQNHLGYKGMGFQKAVSTGHQVIEALRPGVQANTFKHFLNIDDLAVTRAFGLTDEERHDYMLRAFMQVGKKYDFNFDVETDEKIVCSELAYVVYDDFDWPTDRQLGRYTISPDHVAQKAAPNGEFYPVILFHEGKEVTEDIESVFNTLIKAN